MHTLKIIVVLFVIALLGTVAFVASGVYNVAADDPHTRPVFALLQALRVQSIAMHAKDVMGPSLDNPKLLAAGAEHYAAMCTGCHLAPGMDDTEIRRGLYPQPPNLSEHAHASPAEQFWVIKHGVKLTAMPAWGRSHDDTAIWGLVAFLQKLPELSPEEYEALTVPANRHEHHPHKENHHHAH